MTLEEYATAVSLLLLGGAITHGFNRLQPKSKLVYWHPHVFLFENVHDTLSIQTQTYTVQNVGRKTCEQIEILHKNRPDHFRLQPERSYTESSTPDRNHVILIESLAPKEFFTVEILAYSQLPQLLAVRSKDGPAQEIRFLVQQVQPKWKSRLAIFLIMVGLVSSGYAIVKAGEFLYRLMLS